MARMAVENLTYAKCLDFLAGRQRRRLGFRTYLTREPLECVVLFHDVPYLRFRRDGTVRLDSHGHRTMTTKDRLRRLAPSGWEVFQRKRAWYVRSPQGVVEPFCDGYTIGDPLETALNREPAPPELIHDYLVDKERLPM